jgi:hypothetical protein
MPYLRTVQSDDLTYILELRDHVEKWLNDSSQDQFQNQEFSIRSHAHIQRLVHERRFVILQGEDKRRLAVGALVPPDPDFWNEGDNLSDAWYVARLMTDEHGRDYGAHLIDLIAQAAALAGRKYLRLDCWRTNTKLHEYYTHRGFSHVRTVQQPHRLSGALFQRETRADLPPAWDAPQDPS